MPKKAITVTQADIDAAGPRTEQRRRVVYTIMVTGITDQVKLTHAIDTLQKHQVASHLMKITPISKDGKGNIITHGTISVPRLFTLWQGDAAEKAWQQAIKDAVLNCLIDVRDWEPAPGYPQGEIGVATDE